MKQILLLIIVFFSITIFGVKFLYMYQAGYQPEDLISYIKEENIQNLDVVFKFYEEMHENISISVNSEKPLYDIVLVDLIWIPELASKGLLYPLDNLIEKEYFNDIQEYILDQFKYNGKIWALPYLVNIQHFYVNKDILKKAGLNHAPKTLEEMVKQAKIIKEKEILEYPIVDSWKNTEALTCEFTWLLGAFGGKYYDNNGNLKINSKEAIKALTFMKMLLDEKLINPMSLEFKEDDVLDVFINGDAAFTTNWTYQSRYMEDSRYSKIVGKGDLEIIPVSKDIINQRPTVTVSGYQGLAILRNSNNIKESVDKIKMLTKKDFFKKFDYEIPPYKSMYVDYMKEKNYNYKKLLELENAINRPSLIKYNKFSEILRRYIVMTLKGLINPTEALNKVQKEIEGNGLY
jgi:multiple sugar transport system substrate-binding protein